MQRSRDRNESAAGRNCRAERCQSNYHASGAGCHAAYIMKQLCPSTPALMEPLAMMEPLSPSASSRLSRSHAQPPGEARIWPFQKG